ncbi:MAG: hypothetical protein ACYS83_07410 [Planctomycetota bacterium]|jgi:hypothetical protein
MKRKTCFTKNEFLVILACTVFVLASLGAVGSSGRRRAKEAVCVSNLLKWGIVWKSYTDDHGEYFPPRGGGDPWEETMGGWPGAVQPYYKNPKLLFCPEATKAWGEGGCYPYAAWFDYDDGRRVAASYCVNLWVANGEEYDNYFNDRCWRTPYTKGAAFAPLLLDGNWKDTQPYEDDEPWATREQMVLWGWEPNANEMKRVCIDRHGAYVNACFMDLSARRIGLKQLWRTRWHRQWDMQAPLPNPAWPGGKWPDWMQNFKDY